MKKMLVVAALLALGTGLYLSAENYQCCGDDGCHDVASCKADGAVNVGPFCPWKFDTGCTCNHPRCRIKNY